MEQIYKKVLLEKILYPYGVRHVEDEFARVMTQSSKLKIKRKQQMFSSSLMAAPKRSKIMLVGAEVQKQAC